MKNWKQIGALMLLAILSIAIVPVESFHFHEEELCDKQEHHVEEQRFECDVCDFVMPVFKQETNAELSDIPSQQIPFIVESTCKCNKVDSSLPNDRGPPSIV